MSDQHIENGACEIDDHLRRLLADVIAQNEALGPSIVPDDAAREYEPVGDQPVIAVRARDTAGRRVTNFIQVGTSTGLNALMWTGRIADALRRVDQWQRWNAAPPGGKLARKHYLYWSRLYGAVCREVAVLRRSHTRRQKTAQEHSAQRKAQLAAVGAESIAAALTELGARQKAEADLVTQLRALLAAWEEDATSEEGGAAWGLRYCANRLRALLPADPR